MSPALKWVMALLVLFSGGAIRFPEPWLIVGARFALIHVLLAAMAAAALPLFLRGLRLQVAYGALGIAAVTGLLPVFVESARDLKTVTALLHLAAALAFVACFVPPQWRQRFSGAFVTLSVTMLLAGLLAAIPNRRAESAAPRGAFQPSDARTMTGGTLDMHVMNNSELCAGCHAVITREWQESMHGAADLEDPFYMPAHDLMDAFYGALEPGRYCSACHNPGMMLSGVMVTPPEGARPQRLRDALPVPDNIRNEGVSCLACHGQVGSDLRGNGSYILTHPQEAWHFLGGGLLGQKAERLAIESRPDWHRSAMRPVNLDQPEFCASCHTQTVDERLNGFGFLKIRSEYEEWFGGYTGGRGTAQGAMACRDCHMPLVEGFDPANRDDKHRSHRFLGAHTALPQVLNFPDQVDLTRQWLRGEYFPEELRGRWPEGPLIAIQGTGRHGGEAGETSAAVLTVGLTNVKVGHSFPAGTITFADVWVETVVYDAKGAILFEDGVLAPDGTHTAGFRLFGTLVDQHGKLLTMAQTFQAVGMGERHTIAPGYTDTFSYRFDADGPKPWTAEVKLHYRKISRRFQAFSMPNVSLDLPIVTMNQARITFDQAPALTP